jgi:hypothetical protein
VVVCQAKSHHITAITVACINRSSLHKQKKLSNFLLKNNKKFRLFIVKSIMKLLLLSLAFPAAAAAAYTPINEESPTQSYEDMVSMAQTVYPKNSIIVNPMKTDTEPWRIQGDNVVLLPEEIEAFHEKGYIQLPPIFTRDELAEIR